MNNPQRYDDYNAPRSNTFFVIPFDKPGWVSRLIYGCGIRPHRFVTLDKPEYVYIASKFSAWMNCPYSIITLSNAEKDILERQLSADQKRHSLYNAHIRYKIAQTAGVLVSEDYQKIDHPLAYTFASMRRHIPKHILRTNYNAPVKAGTFTFKEHPSYFIDIEKKFNHYHYQIRFYHKRLIEKGCVNLGATFNDTKINEECKGDVIAQL